MEGVDEVMVFVVYGHEGCSFCSKAMDLLFYEQTEYVDVSKDAVALKFLQESGLTTVPQVFYKTDFSGGLLRIGGYSELSEFMKGY